MSRYQWNTPQEWLVEYVSKLSHAQLLSDFTTLVLQLDADTVQDLYQSDMEAEGYFVDLDEVVPDEDDGEDSAHRQASQPS